MAVPEPAPPFPALQTPRLRLREFTADDAPALLAIHGDAELMRWFGTDPLPDLVAAHKMIESFASWRLLPNPGVRWAIEWRDRPGLLGGCGLFGWHRPWKKCSVGYELARHAQGQGVMGEALDAAFAWGFAQMALHRVEAIVHPDNAASLRLLQRLGFVTEGRLRELGHWGGRCHDMLQLSLLRHECQGAASPRPPGA